MLKLKFHFLNEVLPYQQPNKSQFQWSPGCENFYQSFDICPTSLFNIWIPFRSFGRIVFEKDISLQSPPRKLNMQCVNNDFYQEQIETPPLLTQKGLQSLISTEENKCLSNNTPGKINCCRFLSLTLCNYAFIFLLGQ